MLNDSNIGIIANLTSVNHKSIGNSQQNLQFVAETFGKTNDFNRAGLGFQLKLILTKEDIYHDSCKVLGWSKGLLLFKFKCFSFP